MSLHINKFVDLVRATEARGQRDVHMSLRDAKDLHADITRLLGTLQQLQQVQSPAAVPNTGPIELSGGDFKNS